MVPTPKENGGKEKKDESAVMAVSPEPDPEVAADTKLDEINGGNTTCVKLRLHNRFIYGGVDISIFALLIGRRS